MSEISSIRFKTIDSVIYVHFNVYRKAKERVKELENYQKHAIDDQQAYAKRIDELEADRDKWKQHAERGFIHD